MIAPTPRQARRFVDKMGAGGGYPAERQGDWMLTVTGVQFWPIDPLPDEVRILDIAHALSRTCRFGGHVPSGFYSVAEHSLLVSEVLPEPLKLWGLLHDASEAYISDIVRPAKRFIVGYDEVEARIMRAVSERFGLDPVMPPEVKQADEAVLHAEYFQLGFAEISPEPWGLTVPPAEVKIVRMEPDRAMNEFIDRYHSLLAIRGAWGG